MEHKSFNTPLITHKPLHIAHIAMTVEMLIQGRMGINTCGFGPENTGSGCRLLPPHWPVAPWCLHSRRVHGLEGLCLRPHGGLCVAVSKA